LKLNLLFILILLTLIIPFSAFNSGCSCSSKKIEKNTSIIKDKNKIKIKFIDSLSTYIKEVKSLKKLAQKRKINQMRSVYKSHKEIMSQRGDFVIMHGFLKDGANLFKKGKYDEALEEFIHVINQYPEDLHLQAIATKNISICYKKKGNIDEYIKYYKKYYELLYDLPEDEEDH